MDQTVDRYIENADLLELRQCARDQWVYIGELEQDNIRLRRKVAQLEGKLAKKNTYIAKLERAMDDAMIILACVHQDKQYGRDAFYRDLHMPERDYDRARALLRMAGMSTGKDMGKQKPEDAKWMLVAAFQRAEGNPGMFQRKRHKKN